MEFGAFDKERAILPLTMFDNKMDRKSVVSPVPFTYSILFFAVNDFTLTCILALISAYAHIEP